LSSGLILEDLCVGYDETDVLTGVSLAVRPGEITCILGVNGAGKSTLIRAILSLTPPRSGRVLHDGEDITGLPTHHIVRRGIACIPEGRKVFPKMTVRENLLIGAYGDRNAAAEIRPQRVWHIPAPQERLDQLAGTMSGEQAMLSIGRGCVHRVLIIDEPRLPVAAFRRDFSVIRRINETGGGSLVEQNVK
jgi:branched-chain amino acid transport system ATP-binding protein